VPGEATTDRASLTRFAWLSVAAALLTIGLKTTAYLVTGSVGLLADAIESLVNLMGASIALTMLAIAARPPDEDHAYGHSKAEYFSSVLEGTLILIGAVSIVVTATTRFSQPRLLEHVGEGLTISLVASLINAAAAMVILRAGRQYHSVTLEADAHHLLSDVWTSLGVVAGIGLVHMTGWRVLDPIVACLVAINIVRIGLRIVRESVSGLMDSAIPEEDQITLKSVLARYAESGAQFHAIRTRRSGPRRFVSMHVLVPGEWTVHRGHQLLEHIEADLRGALTNTSVFTHLESLDDPASYDDVTLDRKN
jgi:cation diffusion facilitator family transporter